MKKAISLILFAVVAGLLSKYILGYANLGKLSAIVYCYGIFNIIVGAVMMFMIIRK